MKRILSFVLIFALLVDTVPSVSMAISNDKVRTGKPSTIVTSEGDVVKVDDDWESVFPYGAFLFSNSETNIEEGGASKTISLYRMGGTQGRATAYLMYTPTVIYLDEDHPSYGSAAGSEDVIIEVEDSLPIAQYQPLGKDPDPEESDVKVSENEYSGDDADEGDKVLTINSDADSWQWYVLSDGEWQRVDGAEDASFVVSEDMLREYDFRCVFTKGDISYCSDSLRGIVYKKPKPEVIPEAPDDLELNPAKSFSTLKMDSADPYQSYVFAVTFAAGEWVKEIRVSSKEDNKAEPMKFGAFTIADHDGGEIYSEANTVTLTVADNDKQDPYTIGFVEKSVSADKASGKAEIHLKRTGGGQNMVTVDYATSDGTARGGGDYTPVSGTAFFYADVDETVIEIPLLDDGIASDKPLTFTVKLDNLKGDPDGLCTLKDTETVVSLTNSGEGGSKNIEDEEKSEAQLLYEKGIADLSGAMREGDPLFASAKRGVIGGEQVTVPEEELITGEIAGLDDAASGSGEASLATYNYGEISFRGNNGGQYWSDKASVAGSASNDLTGWSGGSAYNSGWKLESDDDASATLKISHMPQMYRSFYGKFEFDAGLCSGGYSSIGFAYGWAGLFSSGGSTVAEASSGASTRWGGALNLQRYISYHKSGTIEKSWNIEDDVDSVRLRISKSEHGHKSLDDVYSRITDGYLMRRVLSNNLKLRIHTANDGDSDGENVATAPDGAAALHAGTDSFNNVYNSIKPEVIVEPYNGGVDYFGRLYVGSRVKVALTNTSSYVPYSGSALNSAVYVTRSNGSIVNGAKVEAGGDAQSPAYYVTLLWDNMTEADLSDTYTINVVMTRKQNLMLDLSPSVPRMENSDGTASRNIDTDRIGEAWTAFWNSTDGTDNRITLGVSEATAQAPHFGKSIREIDISSSEWVSGDSNPLKSLGKYENVQYINFHRQHDDLIIVNGKSYAGDERIYLTVANLAFSDLHFKYYNVNYLDAESVMNVSVNRVELYLDGDGDGRIAGEYNENTGYFVLDPGTEDVYQMYIDPGTDLSEKAFEPELLKNGKHGQYFAKIYYTMTPRSLGAGSDGLEGIAQVLPAITTSITDDSQYSRLTEEQKSYRYILSGANGQGVRTSDGHPMYGAAASAVQYVDVPLGGDYSPVESSGNEKDGYTFSWSPDFTNSAENLLYPFSSPTPLYIEHSLVGENIPLVDYSYDDKSKSISMTDNAKDNLNGYLASMAANTTIALCVAEQEHTSDELHADQDTAPDLQPESSTLIERSASPDASYLTQTEAGSMGDTEFDTADSDQPYDDFNMDYGLDLTKVSNAFSNYLTVLYNKDTVSLTVSVPLLSTSKTNDGDTKNKHFPATVTDALNKNVDQLDAFKDDIKNKSFDSVAKNFKDNGFEQLDGENLKSRNVSGSLSFMAIFTFKYDKVTNNFYFQEFAFGAVGSVGFKYTVRFTVCPLLYVYVSVNVGVTITTGGTVQRSVEEAAVPFVNSSAPVTLKKGDVFNFSSSYANMYIQFNGKLYIDTRDNENASSPMEGANKGMLQSDGGKKEQIQLAKEKGRLTFDENPSVTKFIHIVAMEDTTITYLNPIESIKSELVWSGVSVSPKFTAEFGAGAGIDGLKVELFLKASVSANIVFGKPMSDGGREGFVLNSVSFGLVVGFRAVMLMISYEMEAAGITASYKDGSGWSYTYTLLGKESELSAESDGSKLRLPVDVSSTQRIYSEQIEQDPSDASLAAYDADDPNVPFQLSGFNSSTTAYRLADGLDTGYDYKVITAKDQLGKDANYVLYTVGRPGSEGTMDTSMLVMSRLVTTGESVNSEGYGQDEISIGLVNPLEWYYEDENGNVKVKEPKDREGLPYILVDTIEQDGAFVDDGTGDTEFSAWVSDDGKSIHVAWVSYKEPYRPEAGESTRTVFQKAAKNTVVKRASYDVTDNKGFTAAQVVSDTETDANVSLPVVLDEHITVFAQALHYTQRDAYVNAYSKYLAREGYDPNGSDEAARAIGQYRLTTFENIADQKGMNSILRVSVDGKPADESLETVAPVTAITAKKVGGLYELAFVVDQDYAAIGGKNIHNKNVWLMLSGMNVDESGNVRFIGHNLNSASKSSIIERIRGDEKDISFDNLQFLTAVLDSSRGEETFLLYERGGVLYTILQSEVEKAIYGANGARTEFFDVDSNNDSPTGRTDTVIGVDGAGGLAAVYVGTVPNTSDNGLYIAKYDPELRSWGAGMLLAMRHMDVYEDAVREGWSAQDAEKAYLGKLDGYDRGSMDRFTFSNPQIALGVKAKEEASSDGEVNESDSDSGSSQTTLVIMTQGTMRYLRSEQGKPMEDGTEGIEFFVPTDDVPSDAKFPAGVGIYALSYGVGQQNIGNANLSFMNSQFSAGTLLQANLSFVNTGDVSIRGSAYQPVTVTLSVDGEGITDTKLTSWIITENIETGREVALSGSFTLPMTLPVGAHFNLTVSESEYYVENGGGRPYSATLTDIFTIEQKPELAYEINSVEPAKLDNGLITLDENGNIVLDVDIMVGNRGNADAENVYVQFAYGTYDKMINEQVRSVLEQSGNDASYTDDIIYMALNISDNALEVGEEESLGVIQAESQTQSDFEHGILYLGGIRAGYGRHIQGTLTVSEKAFAVHNEDWNDGMASTLSLRTEIFSDADIGTESGDALNGLRTAGHDEYNASNNSMTATIEQTTGFSVPDQVIMPMGTLLLLPVHFSSSLGSVEPEIKVVELPDSDDLDGDTSTRFQNVDQNLDMLCYESGNNYENGQGSGNVLLRGKKEGNSYVRVMDTKTNSYRDISVRLTEAGEGLDITQGSGLFTFYNANGEVLSADNAPGTQSWVFTNGSTSWGAEKTEPYMNTLAKGKPGAALSFETVAEAIDLYFDGEIRVESDFPGFRSFTLTGSGNKNTIELGSNPSYSGHNVKFTVISAGGDGDFADFDRLVEHYYEDSANTAADTQERDPSMIWSSDFPKKESLAAGQHYFDVSLYILGDRIDRAANVRGRENPSAINKFSYTGDNFYLNGDIEKISNTYWIVPIRFTGNGTAEFRASNMAGMDASFHVNVDWFSSSGSTAALSDDAELEKATGFEWLQSEYTNESKNGITVQVADDAPGKIFNVFMTNYGGYLNSSDNLLTGDNVTRAEMSPGQTNLFEITDPGLYMLSAAAAESEGTDPSYDYEIIRADGSVEKYNALSNYRWNAQFVVVSNTEENNSGGGSGHNSGGGRSGGGLNNSGGSNEQPVNPVPSENPDPVSMTDEEINDLLFPFSDLDSSAWYRQGVAWALKEKVMQGMGEGKFEPDTYTTRAMITTMLWRMEGQPETEGDLTFTDVPENTWYTEAVRWALSTGIVNGYSAETFAPDDIITREQMAAILYRCSKVKGVSTDIASGGLSQFSDASDISGWAAEAVEWCVDKGFMNGMGNGIISPNTGTTRAQAATLFMRVSSRRSEPQAGSSNA